MDGPEVSAEHVVLRGIGVSPGVVIGPVYLMVSEAVRVVERKLSAEEVPHEICRLEDALIETRGQIKALQRNLENRTPIADGSILDAHLMVLDDRAFIEEIVAGVHKRQCNVEVLVKEVADNYAAVLASVEDDYLRERVGDIRDVARRIINNLQGTQEADVRDLQHKHIVVAKDLAPSETAGMRKDMVIGFATDFGSPTSHSAVMARALEIPAIVGLRNISSQVTTGDEVLIDGNKGVLIIHPTPEQLEEYGRLAEARESIQRGLTSLQHEPAETQDGRRIVLSANIESLDELEAVDHYGAEGVGLFRSEYLFLTKPGAVSEEEQAEVYRKVAARLAPAPVIIRTLDVGGDKYFKDAPPREANPFLGCRSIRLSLLHSEPFKEQLRAILRASAEGNVKVMYPMISNVAEVQRANELLEEAKQDLVKQGVPFDRHIDVGVMIEIPAAALTADAIAEQVSFFSLGTNDLIQYTLAVDRVNERVAYLYEPTHPAVLKLIRETIKAGHRHGIWVGLCGEMAADPLMAPLLLGLGVDELSVAPSAVPLVKDAIRSIRSAQAVDLAKTALGCKSGVEVLSYCRKLTREAAPELLELI
jgi:phosphotransferase system enzyme I (PtsI)